jgi:uncharacterized protein (TIGR03437 family)
MVPWLRLRVFRTLVVAVLSTAATAFGQGVITTVAGTDWIFPGDGKPATQAPLFPFPGVMGIAFAANGDLLAADPGSQMVMRVGRDGIIHVIAGNGLTGFSGEDGAATDASLNFPVAVASDTAGNIYIADHFNNRVRKVSPAGIITTVAGNGSRSFSGDGGLAVNAAVVPAAVAVDSSFNLYIMDGLNQRIRKVTPDGIIKTISGTGQAGFSGDNGPAAAAALNLDLWRGSIVLDSAGNIFFSDRLNSCIRRIGTDGIIRTVAGNGQAGYSGDNGPATAATLRDPTGVALGSDQSLYIADTDNNVVRKVSPTGVITTIAGTGAAGFSGDGGPARTAVLNAPTNVLLDSAGNILITDNNNSRVRRIAPDGAIVTVVGNGLYRFSPDGAPASTSFLYHPRGIAIDRGGNIFIADTDNHRIRKLSPDGTITTVAGNGLPGFSGDGGPGRNAQINGPIEVALDSVGNLYFNDYNNGRIRKLSASGIITTIAGTGQFDAFSGDGGPATAAALNRPRGVAVAPDDTLYISDDGNNRIRRILSTGVINTVVGSGDRGFAGDGGPAVRASLNLDPFDGGGLTFDSAGTLYFSDHNNSRVRRVTRDGTISTVAGNGTAGFSGDNGAATAATLRFPGGLAVGPDGSLYIADRFNFRIRRIDPAGVIHTFAGNGQSAFYGDGNIATEAAFMLPRTLAVAGSTVYVVDTNANRIRAVLSVPPALDAVPGSFTFSAKAGGAAAPEQQLNLSVLVPGLPFSVDTKTTDGTPWLRLSATSGVAPSSVQVSADPTNLQPGTYSGAITVLSPFAARPSQVLNVTFTVTAGSPASLSLESKSLTFGFVQGGAPDSKQLAVSNRGSGSLDFTAAVNAESANWLSVSPASGTATTQTPVQLVVTANPGNSVPGTYTGSITVAAGDSQLTIPVTMTITAAQNVIVLSQAALSFTAVAQAGSPLPQSIAILNSGNTVMQWTASSKTLSGGATWLSLSNPAGVVNRPLLDISTTDVRIDPTGLAPGDYYGQIQVTSATAANSPQSISVILSVAAAGTNPGPEIRPSALVFTGFQGSSPSSQAVMVSDTVTQSLSFASSRLTLDGGQWLVQAPDRATIAPNQPARMVVQPDFGSLSPGSHRGIITLLFDDGTSRSISVLSVVAPNSAGPLAPNSRLRSNASDPAATPSCSSTQLIPTFTSLQSGFSLPSQQPADVQVKVVGSCGATVTDGVVQVEFNNGDPSVSLVHIGNGVWTSTWTPRGSAGPVSLVATAYQLQGSTRVGGRSPILSGSVAAPKTRTPSVTADSVANAASFDRNAVVAPGGLVTIFGSDLADGTGVATKIPLDTQLATTQVLLGDRALPLLYVSAGQINAQVPYDLALNTQHQIVVQRGAALSVPEVLTVSPGQPAIFTADQSGRGQGVILGVRSDGSQTLAAPDNPVRAGDTVVIYCGGLGAVNPPVASGAASPGLAPTVLGVTLTIGGVPVPTQYAGLSPGTPALYQINAVVPNSVPKGSAIPVTIGIAGLPSPAVTMASL